MSVYELLLFVHILAAIVWIGGGVTMQLLSVRVLASGDATRKTAYAYDLEWIGQRVYTPASGILLLFGVLLVIDGRWGWGEPFVSGGLAIWIISTAIGAAFLGPEGVKIRKLMAAEGPDSPEVSQRVSRFLLVGRVDLALLVVAVFLMSVKPGG